MGSGMVESSVMDIKSYTPVGRSAPRMLPRTPDEIRMLVHAIREEPNTWFVYSTHLNMASAHNRASQLRGPRRPLSIMEFGDHVEFKAHRHAVHGATVLVRWVEGDPS